MPTAVRFRAGRLDRFALGLVAALGLSGCGAAPDPVARVSAEPSKVRLGHGEVVTLKLDFALRRSLEEGSAPIVFVHLLDAEGTVLRTFDHLFPAPWRTGTTVEDRVHLYHSAIGPVIPPGSYRLTLGLYDGATERWPLEANGPTEARMEYQIATVDVPEPVLESPRLVFSDAWQPVEPGGDAQVVARRWLVESGTLRVEGIPPRTETLWLTLSAPEIIGTLRLVLDEGAEAPRVALSSDCGGFSATLAGLGLHQVGIPVDGPACEISVEPNFHVVELSSLREVSVALEQIGWAGPEIR